MNESSSPLTTRLRQLLGDRTQEWLATESGVNRSTISRLMTGQRISRIESITRIARTLRTDPAELMALALDRQPRSKLDGRIKFCAEELNKLLPKLSPAQQELTLDQLAGLVDLVRGFADESVD